MTKRIEVRLNLGKNPALAAAGLAALGLLAVVGIRSTAARAQSAPPQTAGGPFPKFEIVSIKSCKPDTPGEREGVGSHKFCNGVNSSVLSSHMHESRGARFSEPVIEA